ncbi:MAG: hypothetical protein V3V78_01920 [Candidatus Woesearchaeota archaeon]
MALLEETGQALINPLASTWNSFVAIIPGLIGAVIVLIFGYLVGGIVGFAVEKVLVKTKVNRLLEKKTNVHKVSGKLDLPSIIGLLIKWYVFVLFLTPAAALVNLPALSGFLVSAALWIPNLIAAVLIAVVGLIVADYVDAKIVETKVNRADLIGSVVKVVVIVFTLIIALGQVGIDVSVAEGSVLIILSGIMLALAIGFGLALKDELKPIVKKLIKKK